MVDQASNTSSGFATGGEHPGFANRPHFEGYESLSTEAIGQAVTRYASSYDRSVRANPYLHIGMAGVGALAVGYLIGRAIRGPAPSMTSMSRGYEAEDGFDE